MAITKQHLSGSTNGRHILLTATASGSANPIHTSVAGTTALDEIYIYGHNTSAYPAVATLLWGNQGSAGLNESASFVKTTVPAQSGYTLLVDGHLLNNSLTVWAYANTSSVITLAGFVNNIA